MQIRQQLDSTNSAFRVQLWCLLAAGVLEYLFIVAPTIFDWVFYFYAETFMVVPALLFLGAALVQEQTVQARRQLLLCAGMVLWFAIVQTIHRANAMAVQPFGLFLGVYMLPFPFAAVTRDGDRQEGLKWITRIFIAASLTLSAYTVLLILGLLPSALSSYVLWDGARLNMLHHPNLCACLLMIGIGLCLGLFYRAEKKQHKLLLLLAIAVQFACQSLTHSRTSILLTCGLLGGSAFFAMNRGGWKRFAAGLAAALVLVCTLFLASGALFKAHNAQMIAQLSQQSQESVSGSGSASTAYLNAAGELQGSSAQGTLSHDMRSFNGRTGIWSAAFQALRETPTIVAWGTDPTSATLSYYLGRTIAHTHNSWLETIFRLGLPGLIVALILTAVAVYDAACLLLRNQDMHKTCIALLVLCLLAVGFLENILFCEIPLIHFFDFILFLLMGYMTQWRKAPGSDSTNP